LAPELEQYQETPETETGWGVSAGPDVSIQDERERERERERVTRQLSTQFYHYCTEMWAAAGTVGGHESLEVST
jgi:hypothetical protein